VWAAPKAPGSPRDARHLDRGGQRAAVFPRPGQTGPLPRRKAPGIYTLNRFNRFESTPEDAPRLPIQSNNRTTSELHTHVMSRSARRTRPPHLHGRGPRALGAALVVRRRALLRRRVAHGVRHGLLERARPRVGVAQQEGDERAAQVPLGAKGTPAWRLSTACTTSVQRRASSAFAWSTRPPAAAQHEHARPVPRGFSRRCAQCEPL